MSRLDPQEIRSQLTRLGITIDQSVVLDCQRVGNNPRMDIVMSDGERWEQQDEGTDLEGLKRYVRDGLQNGRKLVFVCDLHVDGNEPQKGVAWTPEERVKGAILGVLSCAIILVRNEKIRTGLIKEDDRLVIATMDEGRITLQEDAGQRMVAFLRRQST